MQSKMLAHRISALAFGISLVLSGGAAADDTEIFVGQGAVESSLAKPNILLVIDTSGSMNDIINTQPAYDSTTTYTGSCDPTRVYWAEGTDPPDCATTEQWFYLSALTCKAALDAFNTTGLIRDRVARWDPSNSSDKRWRELSSNPTDAIRNQYVECQDDSGIHGQTDASTAKRARNGNNGPWSNNNEINWNQYTRVRLFKANYINWSNSLTANQTKMQIVKGVTASLLDQLSGVNVGLMRYSTDADGGMVIHPIENIETARSILKSKINAFNSSGNTPLSETMYEAGLYYMGGTVFYGTNSTPEPSVSSSRLTANTAKYKSPIEYSCQKNYIVYLTDGLPTSDTDANEEIQALNGGTCDNDGDGVIENGECLDDMAEYLAKDATDLSAGVDGLDGVQNVQTYTIGFTVNFPLLAQTATKGKGAYYTANNTAQLMNAFEQITNSINDEAVTFSSPTVAVNAFNRTQNLNDLFITVFQPSGSVRWPGNVKKYRLDPVTGAIEDNSSPNPLPAVDSTNGFFRENSKSYWSDVTDGRDVTLGGAANELPDPATRKVYTYFSGSTSTILANNPVATGNAALDTAVLDLTAAGRPSRDNVINWARGADTRDADGDLDVTEQRRQMGDPLHARPATVIYGGTAASPDLNDAVVYAATNEGYLHAIDPVSGAELWSFIPDFMLPRLHQLYTDAASSNKFYGIDGNIQILKIDHNKNGIVETSDGDKVYLYFGLRRGGSAYYALNITDKNNPEFMWKRDGSQLTGLGQSWSTPVPTRVTVNSATQVQPEDYVLIFGGGYEADQDPDSTTQQTAYSTDTVGNQIFMVDAQSGNLLWSASGAAGANLVFDGASGRDSMNNSIPADIRVIDMDNDGFADRMYAGDMGGRVWRFDITNGNAPASLVAGGVFASLGNADSGSHPTASTRRFYYAPDVSLVRNQGQTFLNIAIGSGYRASPLNTQVEERFYSLRDSNVFNKLTQADYDAFVALTDADPVDVSTDFTTPVPATAKGWKIHLPRTGEKVLAEARTFANQVFFTTYTPNVGQIVDPCAPREGVNRLFVVSALDGDPVNNRENPSAEPDSVDDRVTDLAQGGIAPEAVFLFPTPDPTCTGDDCKPPPQCLVGLENCGVDLTNNPVRTFWTQQNVDTN